MAQHRGWYLGSRILGRLNLPRNDSLLRNSKTLTPISTWKSSRSSRCNGGQRELCHRFGRVRSFSSSAAPADHQNIIKSRYEDLELPEDPFLPHYVMRNWSRYGDNIALVSSETGSQLTYSQLQSRVVKVGSALVKLGFKKGDVATIVSPNCIEYPVFSLGAMSIGMIISPVNPLYTPDELTYSINNTNTSLVAVSPIVAGTMQAALPRCPSVRKVVSFGPVEGCQPLSDLEEDDGTAFPENIDYDSKNDTISIPFSSGTTGLPKGVMLTSYGSVVNMIQVRFMIQQNTDVFLNMLPMFHAFGQAIVLLGGLSYGTKIVTVAKFDPLKFFEDVQTHRPTYLHVVPPMMLLLAKHPLVDKYDFTSIREILYAAAPTAGSTVMSVHERLPPNITYRQGYGMTESGPGTHISPYISQGTIKRESVGVSVPNTDSKIIDVETGENLGPHKEGELCVRGPQMMKGYFGNEEATKNTLRPNGWLHTGDIGYLDDEGFLFITDRLKELIKYKGLQVAPAELEGVLLAHPAVADAAVIGKPDEGAGELPRAYVTLKAGGTATAEELHQFIDGKVAPHKKLRGGIEFRTELPRSATGKLLRRVLKNELV